MFQGIGRSSDIERYSRQLAASYLLFAAVHLLAGAWAAWWLLTQLLWLILLALRWLFAPPELVLFDLPELEPITLEELSVVEVEIAELDEGALESPGEAMVAELAPPPLIEAEPEPLPMAAADRRLLAEEIAESSGLLIAMLGTTSSDGAMADLFVGDTLSADLDSAFASGIGVASAGDGGLGAVGAVEGGIVSGSALIGRGGGGSGGSISGIGGLGHGSGGSGVGMGGLSTHRSVTQRARPKLSAEVRAANGEAVCVLRVKVATDGQPESATVRSCPAAYTDAAREAAMKHRWEARSATTVETVRLSIRP